MMFLNAKVKNHNDGMELTMELNLSLSKDCSLELVLYEFLRLEACSRLGHWLNFELCYPLALRHLHC